MSEQDPKKTKKSSLSARKPGKGDAKPASTGASKPTSKGPGYLARQLAAQKTAQKAAQEKETSDSWAAMKEELRDLDRSKPICYEDVVAHMKPLESSLVDPAVPSPVSFLRLKVTIGESSNAEELFDIRMAGEEQAPSASELSYVLPAKALGALCSAHTEFRADKMIEQFRMVERFWFGNTLLKEILMDFGFCIPGSTNTATITYDWPPIDDDLRQEILDNPQKVRCDSLYFNKEVLFMHHRSHFTYAAD